MLKFRELRADEIEVRIQSVKEKGVVLLLYKNARVDMDLLDETVGCMNWERKHEIIDGKLYCTVSIYNEKTNRWVSKQDVGTESNTEKDKGRASDSFKRACFNWGIGRELYSSPFVWVGSDKAKISNGKCYEKFKVKEIGYDESKKINKLIITNEKGTEVFSYGTKTKTFSSKTKPEKQEDKITIEVVYELGNKIGYTSKHVASMILKKFDKTPDKLNQDELKQIYKGFKSKFDDRIIIAKY